MIPGKQETSLTTFNQGRLLGAEVRMAVRMEVQRPWYRRVGSQSWLLSSTPRPNAGLSAPLTAYAVRAWPSWDPLIPGELAPTPGEGTAVKEASVTGNFGN